MFNMFKQQLMNQIMEEMRARLNIPIKATPNPNGIGDGNVKVKGNAPDNDEVFMGDVDEEEE